MTTVELTVAIRLGLAVSKSEATRGGGEGATGAEGGAIAAASAAISTSSMALSTGWCHVNARRLSIFLAGRHTETIIVRVCL